MTDVPAPLLRLHGVTKRFGRVIVADRVDLDVAEGESVGIVGPNGAGKTSLFGLISGELAVDSGEISFSKRRLAGVPAPERCRLGIGRTYQVPRPFANLTVFENVLVCAQQGAQQGAGERRGWASERALDALELTGLVSQANLPAARLTLLPRKRLEVARALGGNPRLLLLDEVAGGLTDAEVDELLIIIGRIQSSGVTVLWIEHVVHALARTVDRLICLAAGQVIADGPPQEVLDSDIVRAVYLGGGPELAGAA
jgi:branched-chain amino acid transport system ATP-binding protein